MANLKLHIAMAQPDFEVDEEVAVWVLLFNFDDDPIRVNSRFAPSLPDSGGEVFFDILGPDGDSVPFNARVNVGQPGEEDFCLVVPGNCVGRQIDVSSYYLLENPGQYRITATYENRSDGGVGAWVGRLSSPEARLLLK